MAKYTVTAFDVKKVVYEIEAGSPEEAEQKILDGGGEQIGEHDDGMMEDDQSSTGYAIYAQETE